MRTLSDGAVRRLGELHRSYLASLPEREATFREPMGRLLTDGWERETAEHLLNLAHKLAGSAASYGLPELGKIARDLEQAMQSPLDTGRVPDKDELRAIADHCETLCVMLVHPGQRGARECRPSVGQAAPSSPPLRGRTGGREQGRADKRRPLIYVVDDDREQTAQLQVELEQYGFEVRSSGRLDVLGSLLAAQGPDAVAPDAIIMDVIFPEGYSAGIGTIEALSRQHGGNLPPVVFISMRNDFEARVKAVRSGGAAYFAKPLNFSAIAATLEEVLLPRQLAPLRIMAVEDDTDIADYYERLLSTEGMSVVTIQEPKTVMQALIDFHPDLILMDLNLPHCSGLDLARMIRQLDAYRDIPMLFLSSVSSLDARLAALDTGADDYLVKPVEPNYLIRLIEQRIAQQRRVDHYITTDGLTGLLNQKAFIDRLSHEVSRTQRKGEPLSVCMLDLDHFKTVNDTYGHFEGNAVLRSLAHSLRTRLRSTDIIGRFGGEEFAIGFVNTDEQTALQLMNEIREAFCRLRQGGGDNGFHVCFSGGVAQYRVATGLNGDHCRCAIDLVERADRALYVAKRTRNRICVEGDQ